MRVRRTFAAGLAAVLVVGLGAVASADETTPSVDDVRSAEQRAAGKARDVAAIQADLAVANSTLDRSAEAAGRAAEAYNGVLWELEQAKAAAKDARASAKDASRDVRRQQRQYGDALVRSYQAAPEISGVAAMVDADGVDTFIQQRVTMDNTMDALDGRYDRFRASATVAELSSDQADDAEQAAADLESKARKSRDAAAAAAAAALAGAETLAERKGELIKELAKLEGVSVKLARRRQSALEAQAAQRAENARRIEQERRSTPARSTKPSRTTDRTPDRTPAPDRTPDRTPAPDRTPDREPAPRPEPEPRPEPRPDPAPAPSSGTAGVVAFAASKIGDPYVWGASGPNAWDCSGLTAKAWATAGKSLPHWSIGQYRASTPIQSSQLRAGDLVFWGDTDNSSSIFHVALYAGDGMIIHAPRTGRPVVRESMYYWRAPNFYARP